MEKPVLRGHLHQSAFFVALGAGIMLILNAHGFEEKTTSLIYVISLAFLYASSAIYHRPMWDEETRKLLRRLDHIAIFLFFGGTATPVCILGALDESGSNLLRLIWFAVGAGILKTIFWIEAPKWLNVAIYTVVGFLAIPYLPDLYRGLHLIEFNLILFGGVIYTLGGLIYAFKWPGNQAKVFGYHELFHLLVIVGSAMHFAVVYRLVLR